MTSTLPPVIQAFSGALGSAASNTLTYPLDLATTRLQTTSNPHLRGIRGAWQILRHIVRKHGLKALYDGLEADTGNTLLSNFLYFYIYSALRAFLVRQSPRASSKGKGKAVLLSVPEELGLGWTAGSASRAVCAPLAVVAVRLQTERAAEEDADQEKQALLADQEIADKTGFASRGPKEAGVIRVVRQIYAEDGLKGFWRGFETTLPLALNPAITLLVFQLIQRIRFPFSSSSSSSGSERAGAAFLRGALANSVAVALLYPLILAKARLQTSSTSIRGVWEDAYSSEGVRGMYRALSAQLLKGCIGQGVTFGVKERIEQFIVWAYLWRIGRGT